PAVARDVSGADRIRTTIRPGLVLMPNNNVIIVYSNSSGMSRLYASIFDTTANTWGSTGTNVTGNAVTSIVAAPGLPGYDVEVMFNEGTTLTHARRASMSPFAWGFPTIAGLATTNVQGIGVASFR
ncbi:MAG TPA: hypothetical protein PK156_41960, partial [Polyangium sp.]|nr:hypothetical protein [Polyangium sp.]